MKPKALVYIAHPVSPGPDETVFSNVIAAGEYLHEFLSFGIVAIAPYLLSLRLEWEDDSDPIEREEALTRGELIASRCDLVVCCGPRLSEGMLREARANGQWIDLTGYEPTKAAQVTMSRLGELERWRGI